MLCTFKGPLLNKTIPNIFWFNAETSKTQLWKRGSKYWLLPLLKAFLWPAEFWNKSGRTLSMWTSKWGTMGTWEFITLVPLLSCVTCDHLHKASLFLSITGTVSFSSGIHLPHRSYPVDRLLCDQCSHFIHIYASGHASWSFLLDQICSLRKPRHKGTWPRTQSKRDGGGGPATPWRCLLPIWLGPFINIIVREHVCLIVTCSILVHPVFLEKWISLSLLIQDNKIKKIKKQGPENNIGLMEGILTVKGNVPESISSVRDILS